jgi:hypothetical protein
MQNHLFFFKKRDPCDFTKLILQQLTCNRMIQQFTLIDVDKYQNYIPNCIIEIPCIYTKNKDILTNSKISKFLCSFETENENENENENEIENEIENETGEVKQKQLYSLSPQNDKETELPQELQPVYTQHQHRTLSKPSQSVININDVTAFNKNELGSSISDMYSYINIEDSTLFHNFSTINNNVRIQTISDDVIDSNNNKVEKMNIIEDLINKRNMEIKNIS